MVKTSSSLTASASEEIFHKNLVMRLLPVSGFDEVVRWHKDTSPEELFKWAEAGYAYPLRSESFRTRVAAGEVNGPDSERFVYGIYLGFKEKLIATAELSVREDMRLDAGSFGRFVVHPSYRNMGYGQQVTQMIVKKGVRDLGMKRILIQVLATNRAAIRCYNAQGFKILKKTPDGKEGDDRPLERLIMCYEYE